LQRIWLPQGKNPTAIIVGNDSGAPALFDALTARGLRIPDDVTVVGFDNAIGICMTVKPQLTSYAMPFAEVARRGALDLFGLIENPTKPRDRAIQLIRGDLIERASVRKLGA
jgi:LacI family transcriptional regulator